MSLGHQAWSKVTEDIGTKLFGPPLKLGRIGKTPIRRLLSRGNTSPVHNF
jgi:hypothetical protein